MQHYNEISTVYRVVQVTGDRQGYVPYLGCGDARLAAADGTGLYTPGLVVSGQYLADATVADAQLSADVTWSDAQLRQLHYTHAHRVGQGSAIDEHTAQLVHLAVLLALTVPN